jgi:diacylglycerol kinase family enzyme
MPAGIHHEGVRVLAVNPHSGSAGSLDALIDAAHAAAIDVLEIDPDHDVYRQLEQLLPDDTAVFGMAGGDGSLSCAATICIERDIPFVCVPFGTRNHFARDLGLDRKDPIAALAAFDGGIERHVDLGDINGRLFLNNVTFGVYAEAIDDDDYRDAKIRTSWRVASAALNGEHEGDHFVLTGPDGTRYDTPFIALIANNRYDVASLRGLGQRARIDEGVLQVSVIDIERRLDLAGIAATVVWEDAAQDDRVEQWTTTSIDVEAEAPELNVGIDGEAVVMATPVTVSVHAQALRILLPPNRAATGPAATP